MELPAPVAGGRVRSRDGHRRPSGNGVLTSAAPEQAREAGRWAQFFCAPVPRSRDPRAAAGRQARAPQIRPSSHAASGGDGFCPRAPPDAS